MNNEKINGIIRTVVAAVGGSTIAGFVGWASANGIELPGVEEIAGIIAGAIMIIGTAVWSWVSKNRKKG